MPSKNREVKNKTNLEYYYRNKERILEKIKETGAEYYSKNKEKINANCKKFRENNYDRSMYSNIKSRCKSQGIDFNIELSDIIIPEFCPYLGAKLTTRQGEGRVWSNASLDRIDPTKGYVKGNIQVISIKANLMKLNATQEELLLFAKNIIKLHTFRY